MDPRLSTTLIPPIRLIPYLIITKQFLLNTPLTKSKFGTTLRSYCLSNVVCISPLFIYYYRLRLPGYCLISLLISFGSHGHAFLFQFHLAKSTIGSGFGAQGEFSQSMFWVHSESTLAAIQSNSGSGSGCGSSCGSCSPSRRVRGRYRCKGNIRSFNY